MHRTGIVAAVAATAVAWLLLGPLHAAARIWATVLLVPFPALMVVQARMLESGGPLPRQQVYASSIASLWALLLVTAGMAWQAGYSLQDLGLDRPTRSIGAGSAALVATLVAGGIAILFAFRLAGVREPRAVRDLMPDSTTERLTFVAVSVTAGICEEIMFRGFLFAAVHDATSSAAAALVLSSGAFGTVHAYQRSAGALRAALLGALLAVPVLLGQSLYPAILAHALIDILSGLWLSRYLLR